MQVNLRFPFLWLFASCIVFSGDSRANGLEGESVAMVRKLIADEDLSAIARIADQWAKTKGEMYFEVMSTLCSELFNHAKCRKLEYELFLRLSEQMLPKENPAGTPLPASAYSAKARIAHLLVSTNDYVGKLDRESWIAIRSRNTAIVTHFLKGIKTRYILDYVPKPVTKNVLDPTGNLPAGGDPSLIKDPEARVKYETAIRENALSAMLNDEQRTLAILIAIELPKIEEGLVHFYSREPSNSMELRKYLKEAGYSHVDCERLIGQIAGETKTDAP